MHGVGGGQALALMLVMASLYCAICVIIFWTRWKLIQQISYETKHGIYILCNGFPVAQKDVERITDDTINKWVVVLQNKGVKEPYNLAIISLKSLWIKWESFPIINSFGKFAGFAVGKNVTVGYKDLLETTALAHELGHYIYGKWTNTFENTDCHQFMKDNNLP